MTAGPRAVPFRGRAKWGEVCGNLALTVVGAALAAGAFATVPAEVIPIRALAWYTVFAVAATLVLALVLLGTRQLPTLEHAQIDGQPAVGVRAFPGDWWHLNALDLGLGVLAAVITVLGLRAGGDWVVPTLIVAVPGAWFLVRAGLSLVGRRRNEALWLTADAVVHDMAWGRERCHREQVIRVRRIARPYLELVLNEPAEQTICPRLWRFGRRLSRPGAMVVSCSMMGHDPDDLTEWLNDQLSLAPEGGPR